jgi:ribosomal protein S18 acetylase RimI-like enzyme
LPRRGHGELVRDLQQRAARALPAEHVEDVDGWWLRHAPSRAWWTGTVLPHGDAEPGDLAGRVAAAEAFYADRGAPARFQISPGACPDGLDALLAARGYRRESPMSLQQAPVASLLEEAPTGSLRVHLDDRPTTAWFEVWQAVHDHGGGARAEQAMLQRVDGPSAYARAVVGHEVVAVARAVADTGWVGVFSMATLPAARGQGIGRTVLTALAPWAGAHGADRMYLQVEHDNAPALRLYRRAGFHEVCDYHYRGPAVAG